VAGSRQYSGVEIIESGERIKNDNCLTSTRPENRKPICAIARGSAPQSARQLAGAALAVAVETIR
jgi:hypothetical protein